MDRLFGTLVLLSLLTFQCQAQTGLTLGQAQALTEDFKVEKLTPSERTQLADATAALNRITAQIKKAHGQTQYPNQSGTMYSSLICGGLTTTVEIRGGYALITSVTTNPCDGLIVSYANAVLLE